MNQNIYQRYSINRLIAAFSVPAILSLIVEMLTSVVDTAFAGHLGASGTDALTAMGLVSPVIAVFVAFQSLFAVSTAVMISRLLSQKDRTSLDKYFRTGLTMNLYSAAMLSLVTLLLLKPLLSSLGAAGEVYVLAYDYMKIILISNVFSSMGYILTSAIRAFGNPKIEAVIIILSVIINIVFNALFTFGLKLGITGIALGTLVSEIVCALIAAGYLYVRKSLPQSGRVTGKEQWSITGKLVKIGLVQTVVQILGGITAFVVNRQLLVTGGGHMVGSWNVANKMYSLLLMPIIGITQAVQSIIAFFDGNNEAGKVRLTVRRTVVISLGYGVVITAAVLLSGQGMVRAFTSDAGMLQTVERGISVMFVTFPVLGVIYTMISVLQVTGREKQAMVLGLTRQLFTMIPLVFILPMIFSGENWLGITAAQSIYLAVPLADLITLGAALLSAGLSRSSNREPD